ncbi:HASPIN protein kinase [Capronia epimyces CBS 606.96]|uniref:HASPIN protein kinase n=1 Tax=Capronia epimyces CBS 606.96 TaxID=1182542 RepID=W9YHJ5_9EURO|nr:HASPIN protein kinase [Capronia epimyces CBS 606.96]EXJ89145.1 HASPIN protein kinase [Capronia epimyces CBS 606.96]
MADLDALGELKNQQRPTRRFEKTYGKKKPAMAQSRAMHFDLFGGGDENKIVDEMEKLTIKNDRKERVESVPPVQECPVPAKVHPTEHNPRLRGRRKATTSKRMATLTQDKMQALKPLLSLVNQEVQDFQEFGRSMGKKYICTKLGEGAFADVFKLKPKDIDEAMQVYERGGLVIKVIPFTVDKIDDDDIGDLESVTREVRILQTLDPLHGFARCRGVHVVSGKYPDVLLDAFQMFKTTHPLTAINPDPTKTAPADQLYVIIEMDDAGTPVWKIGRPSAFQAFDIFWKTAMVLANAEEKVEFEHRDLHNGNVCYKPLKRNGPGDVIQAVVEDMLEEPEVTLGLSNLQVTVIDYTLARAKVGNDSEGDLVVFDPIQYWEENDAEGESESDKKQYDTYRKVRDWARGEEAKAKAAAELDGAEYEERDKYSRFLPKSNVMWLGYLVADLLMKSAGGRGASLPGSSRAAKRLQLYMWRTLEEVDVYVNGSSPTLMPESAGDLLATAMEMKWLTLADMAVFREELEE